MLEPATTDLDALRDRLSVAQRAFVDALWHFYRGHNQWVPSRIVHQHFGKAAAKTHLAELGPNLVRAYRDAGKEYCRLTFLGVLLTDQGVEAESLLVRYLEYARSRYRSDPRVEWVSSQEVEAALHLPAEESRFLRQLLRLSHWWGGGSAFGEREWTVGLPVDVDDLVGEANLQRYVREHVLRHFPIQARAAAAPAADDTPGHAFWFVADTALRERLVMDWHEAQDVCHVLGWKSCVILCGGILEALLRDALTRAQAGVGRGSTPLKGLVAAAVERRLIREDSLHPGPALQVFRTLIHPGRPHGKTVLLGRTDAEAALDTVRSCLRQLAATTPSPARPAGY